MEEYVAVKSFSEFHVDALNAVADLSREGMTESFYETYASYANEGKDFIPETTYSRLLTSLKREALLFDKIYVIYDTGFMVPSRELATELKWLADRNIVNLINPNDIGRAITEINFSRSEKDQIRNSLPDMMEILKNVETKFQKHEKLKLQTRKKLTSLAEGMESSEDIDKALYETAKLLDKINVSYIKNRYPALTVYPRLWAVLLEKYLNLIATPLLSHTSYDLKLPNLNRSNVAQIVIRDLPLPDANTPWEKIVEYRENQDNKKSLLSLRRWMRKLSAENLSVAECKQELDELKNQFQAHLKLHKMKADTGTLETVLKIPLEILENLVTLKFSKLPEPLFAIQKRQIALMEAELNAPGREIAYLIKSTQQFE